MLDADVFGSHSVSEGHPLGSRVGVPDNGADLVSLQNLKGIRFAGPGRLRGVPLMPVRAPEQVSHLQHLPVLPGLHGQPTLADQFPRFFQHHRPQAESPFLISGHLPLKPVPGLRVIESAFIGIHGFLILQNQAQIRIVSFGKLPKSQPFRLQNGLSRQNPLQPHAPFLIRLLHLPVQAVIKSFRRSFPFPVQLSALFRIKSGIQIFQLIFILLKKGRFLIPCPVRNRPVGPSGVERLGDASLIQQRSGNSHGPGRLQLVGVEQNLCLQAPGRISLPVPVRADTVPDPFGVGF